MMTIGHSNRPWEEFLTMLGAHRVDVLIDVRSIPRSRYNPQFNKETIPRPLAAAGIEYLHLPGLGGRRHPHTDSPNKGWQNPSFRGYADYMQTAEFQHNVAELLELAKERRPALMCAEAVPWRCHRSLIADALVVLGVKVEHLMSATRADPHKLTSFAQVDSGRLTYPPPGLELFPGQ